MDQVDEVKDGIRALESGLTGKKMTEGDLQVNPKQVLQASTDELILSHHDCFLHTTTMRSASMIRR